MGMSLCGPLVRPLVMLAALHLHLASGTALAQVDVRAARALQELAAQDVVWNAPGLDGSGSMPLGNGTLGANLWVESNGDVVLLLAHTDAFSEAERLLKLGRVRITCDPPLATAPFVQRMSFGEGTVAIDAGAGQDAVKLQIFIDSGSDVLHATIESATPRRIAARLEDWRTSPRRLQGAELASSWAMRDAPASVAVEESADIVLSGAQAPDAVAWYHRNEHSIVQATLAHQGLGEFAAEFGDPLMQRTFGCWMEGKAFKRTSDLQLATPGAVQQVSLRIAARCAQASDVAAWINQLADAAQGAGDVVRAAAATAAWWKDRYSRSWIFVDEVFPGPLDNAHPLRIGFDSNGGNGFDGQIARVCFHATALTASEVAALAQGSEAGLAVAEKSGQTWKPTPDLAKSASFSIDARIKPTHDGVTGRIADKVTAGQSDGFLLDLQGGALRGIVGSRVCQSSARPAAGRESHVALVYDGASSAFTLYLDGRAVGSSSGTDPARRTSISQAYAAQRAVSLAATNGAFPVKFNGSIFTVAPKFVNGAAFNEDFRNWGGDYWWQNTRLPYHGMLARGDGDRMESLFGFYCAVLPGCKVRAKQYYDADGAYFPETMTVFGTYGNGDYGWNRAGLDRSVVQCPYWQWAWNQGPELVALMLDHWDHTGDANTLTRRTLPVAHEVLAYFDSRFKRDANGVLVISPTQSVETYWSGVVNDLPTVAGLREITARLCALPIEFGAPQERALWERVRAACPALPRTEDGARYAPAERYEAKRSNCENPELYAVWPFRMAERDLAVGKATYAGRIERMKHGWTQDGMQAARLGLADEAGANVLAKVANTHPAFRYPTFWGPNFDWLPDQCHGGNLLTTVQEMLLQSDGETIRVLPAWPKAWDARFRLRAAHNTVVTGEVKDGKLVLLEVDPPAAKSRVKLGAGW